MNYKYQIGENPDWEMKQTTWKQLRKKETHQSNLLHFIFCMGFIMLGIKVFITYPTIMSCDKGKNTCVIQNRHFWESEYQESEKYPVNKITKAVTKTGHKTNPTIILYIHDKNITLFSNFSSYFRFKSDVIELTNQINHFLKSNDRTLVIKEKIPKILNGSIWIGIGLFLGCIYIFSEKKKKPIKPKNPPPIVVRRKD